MWNIEMCGMYEDVVSIFGSVGNAFKRDKCETVVVWWRRRIRDVYEREEEKSGVPNGGDCE
jgi:hypothetical protein